MKPIAVARRYARALADVEGRNDPSRLEKVAGDLALVATVLERAPEILRFLEDPGVPMAEKEKAIDALGRKASAGESTRRFLTLLIERRRVAALPAIAEAFTAIKDDRLSIVPIEATTAMPLSPPDLRRIRESLEKLTGRSVRLTLKVDPGVLGGARTRIGSRIYDGTLRRKLQILHARLAAAR